jgi:hypothetical protein
MREEFGGEREAEMRERRLGRSGGWEWDSDRGYNRKTRYFR